MTQLQEEANDTHGLRPGPVLVRGVPGTEKSEKSAPDSI